MKKILICLIFSFLAVDAFSQNSFDAIKQPLSSLEQSEIAKSLSDYKSITLNVRELKNLIRTNRNYTKVRLNVDQSLGWDMVIVEHEIRSNDYKAQIISANGFTEEFKPSECHTYSGYVNGDPKQYISLFISEDLIKGLIFDKSKGFIIIEPLSTFVKSGKEGQNNQFVVYNLADSKSNKGFCGADGLKQTIISSANKEAQSSELTSCRILEVATEADFEYYTNHGSNVATTFNDVLAVMNAVDAVYASTFNMRVIIVFQSLYNDPNDPYSSNDIYGNGVITEFKNYWNANRGYVLRDVAVFFTGKNLVDPFTGTELFGSVPSLGAVCFNPGDAYAFTTDRPNNFYTVTHELGHGFNATHPDPNGPDCNPNRSVMCSGFNLANVFFAQSSQNQINPTLTAADYCVRSFESFAVNGPEYICNIPSNYSVSGGPVAPATFFWGSSSNITLNTYSGPTVTATPNGGSTGWVEVSFNVGCNVITRKDINILDCFARYTTYPNPSKDYIIVEFEGIDRAESLPDEISILTEQSIKPLKTINVQNIFNHQTLKNGNRIEIDVRDLPRGTYYLHIKNNRRKEQKLDAIRVVLK